MLLISKSRSVQSSCYKETFTINDPSELHWRGGGLFLGLIVDQMKSDCAVWLWLCSGLTSPDFVEALFLLGIG